MDEDEKTYQQYKHETDEEIERKRGVIRSLIVSRQDVEYNEARMKGLNRVVHERQRKKRSREGRDGIRDWVGVLIAILVGLGAALLSAWKLVVGWLGG